VDGSTCTRESSPCPENAPQTRKCRVDLKKRKVDEEESRMLKADLIVKRIDEELEAKKFKFIELCSERTDLDKKISVEDKLLDAHTEDIGMRNIRNHKELDSLVCKKKKAEEDYKLKGTQVKNIESQISVLKTELKKMEETKLELTHEQDLCEMWIKEVDSEKIKLEKFIEKKVIEDDEEFVKKQVKIDDLKTRVSEVLTEIENLPSVGADTSNKVLTEFIEKEIATKEKELECPICMEIAVSPIMTCSEQHLICSPCRLETEHCPVCSRSYKGKRKLHRYAEQALEEVKRLKMELEGKK
jgi:hypothetical protein